MADFAARAIFHTFLAALTVEALLRLWKVHPPGLRLTFRALVLAVPFAGEPAFALLAPMRDDLLFQERWALFAGSRWAAVPLLGTNAYLLWVGLFAALGLLLLLLDVVPLLADRPGAPPRHPVSPPDAALAQLCEELCARQQVRPPRLQVLESPVPVVMCAGAVRPRLVVSRGALRLLDARELRAALAHELGHLAARDPAAGWVLLAARAVQFFNPPFQVAARLLAREAEWRADAAAVRATGDPLSLASALLKLYRASLGREARLEKVAWLLTLDGPMARARTRAVEVRCRRLLDGLPGGEMPLGRTRLLLAAASLGLVLFFVV